MKIGKLKWQTQALAQSDWLKKKSTDINVKNVGENAVT